MDVGTYIAVFCESDRINQGRMRFQRLHRALRLGARFDKVYERDPDLLDLLLQTIETVQLSLNILVQLTDYGRLAFKSIASTRKSHSDQREHRILRA
jgi:hypothetical protein